MKFNFPMNNFSSGEWGPKMKARTDTEQYMRACEELTNFITQMQGGAAYRAGTRRNPILDATAKADFNAGTGHKLIPYNPLDRDYATHLCVQFPAVGDAVAYTVPDGDAPTYGSNTSFGVGNPATLRWQQLGDLLVMVSTDGTQKPVVMYYDTALVGYRINAIDRDHITNNPWKSVPFGPLQALGSSVTMTPSATTGSITITASATYFTSDMIGAYVKFADGSAASGVARITAYTNGTTVTATVLATLPGTSAVGGTANADSFWQISAWYGNNWPRTVVAHQGRLIFGGNATNPDTIWGSEISDYFDFDEVPSPDTTGSFGFANGAYLENNARPFTLTPNSSEASNIKCLSAAKSLVINTDRSEIVAYGTQGALGPNDVQFESSSSFGAEDVQPCRVNNFLTFVQKGGRKVRDVIFNFNEDQFKSSDLSFVAEHLFLSALVDVGVDRIKEIVKTEGNSSLLWVLTQLGKLYVLTLDRDYQVNAWARVTLGGDVEIKSIAPGMTDRVFEDGNYFEPGPFEGETLVLGTVRNSEFMIEKLDPVWELNNPLNIDDEDLYFSPNYLDCATAFSGASATVWSLGTFYASQEVSVVADGSYVGEYTANGSGQITLDAAATSLVVGFLYEGVIKTMPLEQGGQLGIPVGRQKKIDEMVIRFWNTGSAKFGRPGSTLDEIAMRDPQQPQNESPNYFTGDKVVTFPAGYDRQLQVEIKVDKPYPAYVVAIIPRGQTYDG